jgi:hypothetical protein
MPSVNSKKLIQRIYPDFDTFVDVRKNAVTNIPKTKACRVRFYVRVRYIFS